MWTDTIRHWIGRDKDAPSAPIQEVALPSHAPTAVADIKRQLSTAKIAYLAVAQEGERIWRPKAEAVKALQIALSEAITVGAKPCKDCGNKPHGIEHRKGIGSEVFTRYEVGCLTCTKRALGKLDGPPSTAVEVWNSMQGE